MTRRAGRSDARRKPDLQPSNHERGEHIKNILRIYSTVNLVNTANSVLWYIAHTGAGAVGRIDTGGNRDVFPTNQT
jgi:hypothetical protein